MPIPMKGSIPGRKPRGRSGRDMDLGNLLGGLSGLFEGILKGLGKTIESIQSLEDLEKLAEAQGNEEAKENLKTLKEAMGKDGIDLSKLVKIQSGVRGRFMGRPFGGSLPLERRGEPQETKFEVKGARPTKTETRATGARVSEETGVREVEIDPIEEDENHLIIRGYLAGVAEEDIVCEVQENGTILKISATGERKYEKKVKLPSKVTIKFKWTYKNGVLEVVLTKKQG